MHTNSRTNSSKPRAGEVYLEFYQVGNAVKVSAIDAATGVEVSIMGPKTASEAELRKVAVRKLNMKLNAQN